jgi:prepilin-type N-terminal cleavage/methylation domain-containing protein
MKLRTHRGFSLIELMVVITIGAILAMFALPSFRTYIARSNLTQTANGLLAAMNVARAESIKRNVYVRVDPTVCGTASWSYGAFVWLPAATNPADAVPTTTGDSRVISGTAVADSSSCASGKKITATVPVGSTDVVCYNGSGRVNLNVAASACSSLHTSYKVKLCDAQTTVPNGPVLDISLSGRVSIQPNTACP